MVSTLTPPIRQFVLLTCRPGLLLNVRTNVHNIKTKLKHFLYSVLASTLLKWQNVNRPKRLPVVTCWGVAIAATVTVLTTSHRGRVTDHRINLTLYRLDEVMEGKLDMLIEPIIQEHQADQLAALSEQE